VLPVSFLTFIKTKSLGNTVGIGSEVEVTVKFGYVPVTTVSPAPVIVTV